MILRLAIAAVTVFGGIQFLLSLERDLVPVARFILFALLVVIVTAGFDRQNSNMRGCMTVLALLYAPLAAGAMLLLDHVAVHQWLDPAVGWAGAFRLPAMLACVAGLATLVISGRKQIRRNKRWRAWAAIEIVLTALTTALFAGLLGLAWIGIGAGLRWAGL